MRLRFGQQGPNARKLKPLRYSSQLPRAREFGSETWLSTKSHSNFDKITSMSLIRKCSGAPTFKINFTTSMLFMSVAFISGVLFSKQSGTIAQSSTNAPDFHRHCWLGHTRSGRSITPISGVIQAPLAWHKRKEEPPPRQVKMKPLSSQLTAIVLFLTSPGTANRSCW